MTEEPDIRTPPGWFDFDIRREGRPWTGEEVDRKYLARENLDTPGKMELIDGKLFWSDGQRITMLGWMLEMVGADVAVRLGDPDIWRAAVDGLAGQSSDTRVRKLEALADAVREVVNDSSWRDRNLDWPDGMPAVEQRLRELDQEGSE